MSKSAVTRQTIFRHWEKFMFKIVQHYPTSPAKIAIQMCELLCIKWSDMRYLYLTISDPRVLREFQKETYLYIKRVFPSVMDPELWILLPVDRAFCKTKLQLSLHSDFYRVWLTHFANHREGNIWQLQQFYKLTVQHASAVVNLFYTRLERHAPNRIPDEEIEKYDKDFSDQLRRDLPYGLEFWRYKADKLQIGVLSGNDD